MKNKSHYYVYVYIDPRNYEEFYYGKGKGKRKEAHLRATGESEKVKRISAIKKEGLEPIIKVIAKNLTEGDALLIEKTLIWKLGRTLVNVSPGHYSETFRPHDTLHKNISGFDFQNGIYYVNIGQGKYRLWEDCKKFGFVSAGGSKTTWRDQIMTFNVGDIVVAYLKHHGYVGIGVVKKEAVRPRDFLLGGKHLSEVKGLQCKNMMHNSANAEKSEYLVKVDWKISVDAKDAKWEKKSVFTTQLVKASLDNQQQTLNYLESEFKFKFSSLLNGLG